MQMGNIVAASKPFSGFLLSVLLLSPRLQDQWSHQDPLVIGGMTPINYQLITNYNSGMSIKEISEQCGYDSAASFCRAYKRESGLSPTEIRNLNKLS